MPGVTKVDVYGNQDERIFVEFSHAKLATLGITPQALFDSLAKQNNVTPAGTVETSAQRVPLRVTGALDGAKAVAETPVESNGRVFRLGISPLSPTAISIRRASSSARKARPRSASASSLPRAPISSSSARRSRRRRPTS